ncbi:MAG TPA: hypothetical protein VII98_11140 [Solirubrobacteraceae bacterium]
MIKRTQIAAGGTLVALGVLGAFAAGASTQTNVQPAKAPTPPPVEVRTVVVRRTVKVIRHEKPKKPVVHNTPAAAPPPAPVQQAVQVAQTRPVYSAPAPATRKPLSTKTSGASGGSGSGKGDDGSEGGGGHDD